LNLKKHNFMKKGQIILGAASAIVAIASGLAFKSHHFTRNPVYGKTGASSANCKACNTFRTGTGFTASNCKTSGGVHALFATLVGGTAKLYTQVTTTSHVKCAGAEVSSVSETK
jgi:hypothetical protein